MLADPHAPAGSHSGVGVHPRLLGQQGKLHQRAVDDHREAAHQRHVVAVTLAEARQLGQLADDEEHYGAGHGHQRRQQEPRGVYVGQPAEAHKEQHHQRQAQHRAPQVVEYLPASYGVHLVLHALSPLVPHMRHQPRDNLPVAARPAVVALGVVYVVAGVVVEELHVVDEAAAYVAPLEQVVAQDEVLREGPLEHLLEHAQVVDALAAERALVEDVLIKLEAGGGVHVKATQAGKELRIAALVGYLHVDVHPRLHDAVAAVHPAPVGAQPRAVQRVRHGAYELLRRVEHQLGVRVEGDDELYVGHRALAPGADSLAAEPCGTLSVARLAEQQVVEMQYGSALALVAQPCALALAPRTAAVDEVEYRGPVFLVELLDLGQASLHHLVVPRRVGLLVGRGVAYQRVVQVLAAGVAEAVAALAAVYVAQVVHLQLLQQLLGLDPVLQDGGHDDHRGVLAGDEPVLELELEGAARLVQLAQQPVEEVYHHLAHGHPQQRRQHSRQPAHAAAPRAADGKDQRQRQRRKRHYPDIDMCAGIPRLGREELPAHMLAVLVGLGNQLLHKLILARPGFPPLTLLDPPHHHGAVVLLRLVLHLVVHPRLLALEHALREAHGVYQLCHRQLGHLLQRVEDVHHLQVLSRRLVEVRHVGLALVRRLVVVGLRGLQRAAQFGQLADEYRLHQRQQRRHLGIRQIVLLPLLHLGQIAEHQRLVYLVVALLQVPLKQVPQHLDALVLHLPPAALHSLQLVLQHLLLLADHVVVVKHPLVGAANQTLAARLLDQQHVIFRYILDTLSEYLIYTLHSTCSK